MTAPIRTSHDRLVTAPFVAVMSAALAFFVYIGITVVTVPRLVENELGSGEFGVGLTLASFAIAAVAARPLLGRWGDVYGRRRIMFAGALVAGLAGVATGWAESLGHVLVLRGLMGVGEAAMFVGAATLVADLSPPERRAEAASYFSVAVFGGIGVGPVLGEWVLADDRYAATFAMAGAFAFLAAVVVRVGIPARVDRAAGRDDAAPRRWVHPAAIWPGAVLACGTAAFAVFTAFVPEYARDVGLPGAGGLFLLYSVVCIMIRVLGARLPARLGIGRMVTVALSSLAVALLVLAAVPEVWGLWVAAFVIAIGMSFQYPSLMAAVVDRVDERERATALSSFTAFFEIGTMFGGIVLGAMGELAGKRAGFAGGTVICLVGLTVLWTRVVAGSRSVERPVPSGLIVAAE